MCSLLVHPALVVNSPTICIKMTLVNWYPRVKHQHLCNFKGMFLSVNLLKMYSFYYFDYFLINMHFSFSQHVN